MKIKQKEEITDAEDTEVEQISENAGEASVESIETIADGLSHQLER